jgi:hypothetical protein
MSSAVASSVNSTPASSASAIRGHRCYERVDVGSRRAGRPAPMNSAPALHAPPADPPDAHSARHTTRCARFLVQPAQTRIPTAPPCPTASGALIHERETATAPCALLFLPLFAILLIAAFLLTPTRSFDRARSAATQKINRIQGISPFGRAGWLIPAAPGSPHPAAAAARVARVAQTVRVAWQWCV